MRAFLVEDDVQLAELMSVWLEVETIDSTCFYDGKSVLDALGNQSCDLIVLDWNLPDIQGDELLFKIRNKIGWETPIIFTSSRTEKDSIVTALENGANDYITKPIDRKEWVARVRLQLRQKLKQQSTNKTLLQYDNISINTETHSIAVNSTVIRITPKEYEVALQLFANIGEVVSRDAMMKNVWGYSDSINTRTVDTHISRIRKKLKLIPANKWSLTSIYSFGYRLERL